MKLPYGLRMLYIKMLTNRSLERRVEQTNDEIVVWYGKAKYIFHIRPHEIHYHYRRP